MELVHFHQMFLNARINCNNDDVENDILELLRFDDDFLRRHFGTNRVELNQIMYRGHRSAATLWLKLARRRFAHERITAVQYVQQFLRKAQLTYEEIGTTAKEIKGLNRSGHHDEATCIIMVMKGAPIEEFVQVVAKSEPPVEPGSPTATLSSMNTPGPEQAEYWHKDHADNWFHRLQTRLITDGTAYELAREAVRRAGVTFSSLGISRKQIYQLRITGLPRMDDYMQELSDRNLEAINLLCS